MDSFTCGLCKTTFHKLEEFTEHKQSHNLQTLLKTAASQQDTEIALETEASCCDVRLPLFCPSLSQLGTTSSSPVRLPPFSMAPIISYTNSGSFCPHPISSAASSNIYVGNSSNVQTSAINSTELIQSAPKFKNSKLVPATGTVNSLYSMPNTLQSVVSTTRSEAVSKMCLQTLTSDTSVITSRCARKMPNPANLSVQSSSSHVPPACILPPCSVGQISNTNANNEEQVSLIHNSDILQQNMSKNEIKDIILIEISAATEKNPELITKVDVPHPELIEGTFGRATTGTNDLTYYHSEIREQIPQVQRSKKEVTCLISELNEQVNTTPHACLSVHSTDSFVSTVIPSNLSVEINDVKQQCIKTNISTHSVTGKTYNCVANLQTESDNGHNSNCGPAYVTEGCLPYKQTTPNMDKLVCKDASQMSSMKNGNIVHTSVNISSEFNAEKLNFNQASDMSAIYINSDELKFEDQTTDVCAQRYQAKLIGSKSRPVSAVSVNGRNEAIIKDEISSGTCDMPTEDSNGAISRTKDDASGVGNRTNSKVTAETITGDRYFVAGNTRTGSVLNTKLDAEFDGTAMGLATQIDEQARYETEVVITEGNNRVNSFCAESSDETASQIINEDVLTANNRRNESSTRTGSLDQTGLAIRDNSKTCIEHIDGPTSDATIQIVAQTGCEIPLLNDDDGTDLVNSSGLASGTSDVSDLPCSSAPGIYTLLLNADNTFTLVAGGYQGSAAMQSSQVFVCRHCKKFALSQVEVLNHVSTCHPEDMVNINQCILEFSALPSSCSETSDILNDTDQIFHNGITLNMETASQGTSNCLVVERCANSQTIQEEGHGKLSVHKRTTRRKLGRPSKEDMVIAEDQNREPKQIKRFKMEGNNIVCLDCKKVFLKQRQFDKHKCHMWQLSLEQLSCAHMNNLVFPQVSDEKMPEYFFVEDSNRYMNLELHRENLFEKEIEEEWKGSRIYRTKVKAKPSTGERRRRGRPPKVDTLACDVGSHEGHSEGQKNENQTVDEREKSSSSNADVNSWQEHKKLQKIDTTLSISDVVVDPIGQPRADAEQLLLKSIPTLPLFSNSRQQERLHKWIAQTDLSFVDSIIDKVYPDGVTKEKNGIPVYVCQECKVLFRTLLSCRRHCAKHMSRKAFTCPDCDFATTNVGALYSHYRNHTQNLYSCDKCDFKARIKAHYRDHLETHNPSRHICRLCQRPYSTSNSLRSHIYLNHRNEEGMNYLWSLRRKNREQNKQSCVFQCPICNRIFSERLLANKHMASHGPSIPKAVKCEVCHLEPLHHGMLKRHFQKHKVIYICCVCYEPHANVNSLHSHFKEGSCSSSHGDTFNLSLMCSYTAPETFPSLFSNKKLGPFLQELIKHQSNYRLPDAKVPTNLLKQIQDTGYRQIHELLQEEQFKVGRNGTSEACDKVMKIVVDTRCTGENEQILPWEQDQTSLQYREHELNCHQPRVRELEQFEESRNASNHCLGPPFLMNQYQQDLTTEETDQKVVVISNVGEEQTVVVEEGQMTLMDEERFVIIHEESEGKQPKKLDRFLSNVS